MISAKRCRAQRRQLRTQPQAKTGAEIEDEEGREHQEECSHPVGTDDLENVRETRETVDSVVLEQQRNDVTCSKQDHHRNQQPCRNVVCDEWDRAQPRDDVEVQASPEKADQNQTTHRWTLNLPGSKTSHARDTLRTYALSEIPLPETTTPLGVCWLATLTPVPLSRIITKLLPKLRLHGRFRRKRSSHVLDRMHSATWIHTRDLCLFITIPTGGSYAIDSQAADQQRNHLLLLRQPQVSPSSWLLQGRREIRKQRRCRATIAGQNDSQPNRRWEPRSLFLQALRPHEAPSPDHAWRAWLKAASCCLSLS